MQFVIQPVTLSSGNTVAVVRIHEFMDIPHICAKQFDPVLRKGALYVRPRRVPETVEVASSVEMREVIQLAVKKALRSYVETAERAGIALSVPAASSPPMTSADSRFEEQRQGAWR